MKYSNFKIYSRVSFTNADSATFDCYTEIVAELSQDKRQLIYSKHTLQRDLSTLDFKAYSGGLQTRAYVSFPRFEYAI